MGAIGEKLGLCIQYTQALTSTYMLVVCSAARKALLSVFFFAYNASTKTHNCALSMQSCIYLNHHSHLWNTFYKGPLERK